MVVVILLVMVSASLVLGDPINETCTVTTGPFSQQTRTCRRIGEVISNGGGTVKRVNTTHTVVTGQGQSGQLDVPSNSESVTDQHDKLIYEINRQQDELNNKITYLQNVINNERNARNRPKADNVPFNSSQLQRELLPDKPRVQVQHNINDYNSDSNTEQSNGRDDSTNFQQVENQQVSGGYGEHNSDNHDGFNRQYRRRQGE